VTRRLSVPFFKLQIAGNGFVLADLASLPPDARPSGDALHEATRLMCGYRFGIGASGAVFLGEGGELRAFSRKGEPERAAEDALLCAARFAFDSGRVQKRAILFKTPYGERTVEVLGAHEFRISCGSPFSLLGGQVITPLSGGDTEIIEHEGIATAFTALHIAEDILVAFPQSMGSLDYRSLKNLAARAFPKRRVTPVIARCITRDTLVARVEPRFPSTVCAAACGTLVASVRTGTADRDALVLFDFGTLTAQPDAVLERDRDQSRRLAASWDAESNELYVTGSGGYVFEGKFDLSLT